jgi:hypothetical protein
MRDELSLTLDELDFAEAYRAPSRPRWKSIIALLLALTVGLLIFLLFQFPEARLAFATSPLLDGLAGVVIFVAILLALLLLAAPALRRRAGRSTLEGHPGMRDPVHYAFDAENFMVRTTYTQASYPWTQLWNWRETARVILVMPTPRNFYVIPKRGVDPAVLERLRRYLAQCRKRAVS